MVSKSELTTTTPDWWSHFYSPVRQFGERVAEFFSPSSEAAATENNYEITLELPGVSDDDISVEIHENRLTVSGEKRSAQEREGKNFYFSERAYGSFQRAFRLPDDADAEKITASHNDGVLTIKVARLATATPKAKKVEIVKH